MENNRKSPRILYLWIRKNRYLNIFIDGLVILMNSERPDYYFPANTKIKYFKIYEIDNLKYIDEICIEYDEDNGWGYIENDITDRTTETEILEFIDKEIKNKIYIN